MTSYSTNVATTDSELITLTLNGCNEAFGDLVRRHQDRLYNAVVHIVGCPSDAEDVLQDAFILALTKLSTFRGQSLLLYVDLSADGQLRLSQRRRKRPLRNSDWPSDRCAMKFRIEVKCPWTDCYVRKPRDSSSQPSIGWTINTESSWSAGNRPTRLRRNCRRPRHPTWNGSQPIVSRPYATARATGASYGKRPARTSRNPPHRTLQVEAEPHDSQCLVRGIARAVSIAGLAGSCRRRSRNCLARTQSRTAIGRQARLSSSISHEQIDRFVREAGGD